MKNQDKWILEITRPDGKVLTIESYFRDMLLQKARLYHEKHPDSIVKVYQKSCIFIRETVNE